ncbi:transcriptional regulator [Chryseobacterium lacus]|uniref:Transcriptional regulator n=1 Tax=Chryseobacterium lacus TaxID=2058346 RepID=A0A368MY41_9FLAO|nr:helix-turn-helix transcriptional regulator [Chryseobacterium lacus]RCU43118.1 transcriptional regulator [Chryseobacterium lacus]RST27967.1 transcriptional regulator [Chryseobacterium lacus]
MLLSNIIREVRAKWNMTQQELADRTGVSRQTINSIESGKYVPSTVLAIKIAMVFNTTVNEIFELKEKD